MVVVNVELTVSNDYATPEPGMCFESAGMGGAPSSAVVALLNKSRPVMESYFYSVDTSARTKLRVLIVNSKVMLWKF